MSGEEQNRSFYKETFEEVPVPEGLAEKVGRIAEEDAKRKRNGAESVMRKVAIAVAVLTVLFAGSNGIAYAMTGETWVEKIIIRRNIDGIDYEVEAEKRELRNGETIYIGEVEIETEDGGKIAHFVETDGDGMYLQEESVDAEIWSSDGRTYIWDEDVEIEITEDLEDDGRARGLYEANGVWKGYAVKKTDEYMSCDIEIIEIEEGTDWGTHWKIRKYLSREEAEALEASLSATPVPEP